MYNLFDYFHKKKLMKTYYTNFHYIYLTKYNVHCTRVSKFKAAKIFYLFCCLDPKIVPFDCYLSVFGCPAVYKCLNCYFSAQLII